MPDPQDASSAPPPPRRRPRRRWHQFGLRALFVAMTGIIGLLVLWRIYVEPYRQQRDAMAVIKRLGGTFETREAAAWQRRLFGEDAQDITLINLADSDKVEEHFRYIARLPCLETLIVGGAQFKDEHLRRLNLPTLTGLVLDSTAVTDEALAVWATRFPSVELYRSQRRAIAALRRLPFEIMTERSTVRTKFPASLADDLFEEACLVRGGSSVTVTFDVFGSPDTTFHSDVSSGSTPKLGEALSPLRHLHTVRWLYLWSYELGDEEMAYLQSLVSLESLDLTGVRLTDRGIANIAGLRNLRWLYLNGTPVSDEGLAQVAQVTALAWLELDRTGVSDVGLAALEGSKIGYLSLCETRVTDVGLARLRANPRLKDLRLVGTRVTTEGVADFRSARPECFVQGPSSR